MRSPVRIVELGSDVVGWRSGTSSLPETGPGCRTCWQCTTGTRLRASSPGCSFLVWDAMVVWLRMSRFRRTCSTEWDFRLKLPRRCLTQVRPRTTHGQATRRAQCWRASPDDRYRRRRKFRGRNLKAITNCRVIAIDARDEGLELARGMRNERRAARGANNRDEVLEITGGDVCSSRDCAGAPSPSTLPAPSRGHPVKSCWWVCLAEQSKVGGHVQPGVRAHFPFGSNRRDLVDLMTLIRDGKVKPVVETFPFDDVVAAYGRLAAGEVVGRAVALFD